MQKKQKRRRLVIIIVVVTVTALCAVAAYVLFFRGPDVSTTPSTTAEEDQASVAQGQPAKNQNAATSSQSDKATGSSGTAQGDGPVPPTGNFVSNHSPMPNDNLESLCVSTPGAVCDIRFSSGSTTISLGKKTIGSNGSVDWFWRPADIGITSGDWQIVASVTYNNKTVDQTDPLQLRVGQ